jgi:predicted MFS family arabinose efflux permease
MQDAEDRRIGRLIGTLGLAAFASAMTARITDPLVAEISAEFTTPVATTALLASVYALPFALVQPFLGPVGDALGKRRIIMAAQGFFALFVMACAFAPDFGTLATLRALSGAAGGGTFPLMLALIGDEVPLAKRQVAIGRFMLFSILGQISGGAAAALLEPWIGWRGVIALAGALAMVAWVVLVATRRTGEPIRPFRPAAALARYGQLLRMPHARVLYAAVAINGGLALGIGPYLAPLLLDRGLGGTQEAGLVLAAFGVGGLIFTLTVARLLALDGQRGLLRMGGAAALAGMALLPLAGGLPALLLAGLLMGLGFIMVHNTIQVRASELAPDARGAAMALHAFGFFTGQFLGPILYGASLPLLGMAVTCVAAGLALAVLAWRLASRG